MLITDEQLAQYVDSIISTQSTGVDTSKLSEQEIKEANTGDKVFLQASIQILDAIEDINLNITI